MAKATARPRHSSHRGGGRTPGAAPKSEIVHVRTSTDDRVQLAKAATVAGKALTTFIREAALEKALSLTVEHTPAKSELTRRGGRPAKGRPGEGRWQTLPPRPLDPLTYNQVRALGVNLNQLTRLANTYKDKPLPAELAPLLADIRQLLRRSFEP